MRTCAARTSSSTRVCLRTSGETASSSNPSSGLKVALAPGPAAGADDEVLPFPLNGWTGRGARGGAGVPDEVRGRELVLPVPVPAGENAAMHTTVNRDHVATIE